jgi:ATP-dependent protease HslVU (ClpYQ) peptidase subunit
MTCIVGMIDKKSNKVIIGGDSLSSTNFFISSRKDTKVFKKGSFVIGCTSSFRMIQLLRFSLVLPEINKKDIYEYMCTDFIDAVRECFSKGGFLQKEQTGEEIGGQFLVGYEDRLFIIDNDFQVGETYDEFNSIGCGSDFALGCIYLLRDKKIPIENKIRQALEAAEHFSPFVKQPFIFETT